MKLSVPKLSLKQSPFRKEKFGELYKKFFQDKNDKILQDLIELESENPDDMRVKQKIAELYYKKDMIDEAVTKYAEIAKFYEKEEFILKAIKAIQSLLKIKPDLVEQNLKLGSLYLKLGMSNEAANQYRIAINHYAAAKNSEKTISLSQTLVKIDPSNDNRAKLAEIYQSFGMRDEALKQYEQLAKFYRQNKDYNKLLHFCELILPHKKDNHAMLRDVCILHMRNKRPERAIKIMEHYHVSDDPSFEDLKSKAKLMIEALRKRK